MAPHAPLLLPEVAGPKHAFAAEPTRRAVASLDLAAAELVVIASPHGRSSGVYARTAGDLDAFGPGGIDVDVATDLDFLGALTEQWGRPVLDEGADHGVVVPLRLLPRVAPVVAVAFEEGLQPEAAVAEAETFVSAFRTVARGRRVAFVASANLSAGLGERAPLPSLEGAEETDDSVLGSLRGDPAGLVALVPALVDAGSCAAAPLAAFGMLFAGTTCDVVAYEHPFGVGYPVALTR